jgi:Fe-Mn family superoxide dismutase
VSNYNNNCAGAVKRLDAISAQSTELDYANAPTYMITGSIR